MFDFNYNDTDACNTGHFIIALDVERFTPLDTFKAEMDRHLRDLRTSKPLPGFDRVRLPGQERRARRADRLKNGVPLPRELIAQLDHAGRRARHQAAGCAVGSTAAAPIALRTRSAIGAGVAQHLRDQLLRLLAGDRIDLQLSFFASARNSGSFMVASKARRSACTRSSGTPGGTK